MADVGAVAENNREKLIEPESGKLSEQPALIWDALGELAGAQPYTHYSHSTR